mmetsp:Transcript_55443/g.92217  ORF Transcript_55443/g.92217 Transcript_55443/m.92217 type:complete len:346 (+) Transcript_55443:1759-2796(+)
MSRSLWLFRSSSSALRACWDATTLPRVSCCTCLSFTTSSSTSFWMSSFDSRWTLWISSTSSINLRILRSWLLRTFLWVSRNSVPSRGMEGAARICASFDCSSLAPMSPSARSSSFSLSYCISTNSSVSSIAFTSTGGAVSPRTTWTHSSRALFPLGCGANKSFSFAEETANAYFVSSPLRSLRSGMEMTARCSWTVLMGCPWAFSPLYTRRTPSLTTTKRLFQFCFSLVPFEVLVSLHSSTPCLDGVFFTVAICARFVGGFHRVPTRCASGTSLFAVATASSSKRFPVSDHIFRVWSISSYQSSRSSRSAPKSFSVTLSSPISPWTTMDRLGDLMSQSLPPNGAS